MSLKQSLIAQERAEKFRKYIKKQICFKPKHIILDDFPKWSISFSNNENIDDGSWNYGMIENSIAYSELKKYIL